MKRKAPGTLPNPQWLLDHGYGGLVQTMRGRPEAFAHIEQKRDKSRRTHPEEWVSTAKELAKKHGKIPTRTWLRGHGYGALALAMYKRPELFKRIKQERHQVPDWVSVADRLVKQHGKLPNPGWLEAHGYDGLCKKVRICPELFTHIGQERKRGRKTRSEEQVVIAERLAKKHGMVPNRSWLRKHGHSALYSAMRRHPALFVHLEQKSLWTP